MSIVWASVIVVAVTAFAIAAMLLVRRHAPQGGYFEDGDRAAGVFGILATGFAVLAGFVVFLAFESFDTSRSGAEAEARIVAQQFETVQFLPAPAPERLSGDLVCYARSVVHQEWPQMTAGTLGNALNPWGVALFRSLRATEPRSASEQAAYGSTGPVAGGGRAIEARRSVSGVDGTRISPRVGRSRSNVTNSSSVTSAAARTTVTTPRPTTAR